MDGYYGQILMVGFNFAPRNWAFCDGQLISIAQNQALFALIGNTFGGDGRTTYALPDMRSRVPVHPGQGPGLSFYQWGQIGGFETRNLSGQATGTADIPTHLVQHTHTLVPKGNSGPGDQSSPAAGYPAADSGRNRNYSMSTDTDMASLDTGPAGDVAPGSTTPVNVNMNLSSVQYSPIQPYLAVYFVICLEGIFPSRP